MGKGSGISFNRKLFDELISTTGIENGINRAIGLIGREFNASRVYIYENSDDDLRAEKTFEWCADGIAPGIDSLTYSDYKASPPQLYNL